MLAEIHVDGAVDTKQAKAIARRIATSPLVKTALFGHDANWGRVLMAAGSAPYNGGYADIDADRATLRYNDVVVLDHGTPTERRAGRLRAELHDRARARAGRRQRQLPDQRPLVRLRAHQRGLPVVSGLRLVVKVGGAVAAESTDRILGLREEGHEVVVVHGAGPQITHEMKRRGIPVEFVNGRRRTSRRALDVVRESLVVGERGALRRARRPRRAGASATPHGLLAVPVPPLGWVGDPLPCRPKVILDALAAGKIPVVAPLAVGPLNVNADDASAALALGLGAPQARLPDRRRRASTSNDDLVDSICAGDANAMLDAGEFDGGIVPKLRAAAIAAAQRHHRAHRLDGGGRSDLDDVAREAAADLRAAARHLRRRRGRVADRRHRQALPRPLRRHRRRRARSSPPRSARRRARAARPALARLEPLLDRADAGARR